MILKINESEALEQYIKNVSLNFFDATYYKENKGFMLQYRIVKIIKDLSIKIDNEKITNKQMELNNG